MTTQSSSTTESPFSGSSSASLYQIPQQQGLPCPHVQSALRTEAWWQKPESVIALMGMALTGVIGYFSATLPIRDSIADNLSRVKVIETKIDHIEQSVADNKKTTELVQRLDRELAVIETRLNDREQRSGVSRK